MFQVPKNQGVAVISLTRKIYTRESLKQQSHEIQNKATTGEQIKWGTNWGVYKSESQNVNTFRVYYLFSMKEKLNWQTDLSIYYLYDYACDFCILKGGNNFQLQGKFK